MASRMQGLFRNDGNGYFYRAEGGLVPSEDPLEEGWNTSIVQAVDVDGDGWHDGLPKPVHFRRI